MNREFKRVPALDKCFGILDLFARSRNSMGISDISKALGYNKSTVFNMVYTLEDLGILECGDDNKFHFGTRLYALGKAAAGSAELITRIHPYLEEINEKTRLSAFLGIRAGLQAVIVDKADTRMGLRLSSDVGMSLSIVIGAGGKALLSQLSDAELDEVLSQVSLKKYTPSSITNIERYKEEIGKVRREGIAYDIEEYSEGIRAAAVPLNINRDNLQIAIWAVGLQRNLEIPLVPQCSEILKDVAKRIETRFSW